MEITLYRGEEIGREARSLPAGVYKLAKRLISRSPGVAFVPIRSMQYLAILDGEEFVFVDHLDKGRIRIAWQHFRPQQLNALDEPVPFESVSYCPDSREIMQRLVGEFPKAMQQLDDRERVEGPARVLKFERPPE